MRNVKTASIKNYVPLTAKEVQIKRQDNLFRNSDTESDLELYSFHLEYQAHLDRETRVDNIISEMKDKGSSLIEQLQYLIQTIIEPLLSESWFEQCHHDLMYCMVEIYNFHNSLICALSGITHGFKVGELLLGYAKDFKEIYSKYVSLLPKAVAMSSREISEFLRSKLELCSSDSAVFLKFVAFLHVPFQRRKNIFTCVRRILQLIPVEHPDHQSLLDCWKSYKITTSVLSELLSRAESEEELYTVETHLVDYQGPPLRDFGLIRLKAPFNIKCGSRKKERFVYLLEKCILILKGKKSFFGNQNLSHLAINSDSAAEMYVEKIILLDKEHFRAVALWDIYESKVFAHNKLENAFRVIYADETGSTRFVEFSASSRYNVHIWINEIRGIGDANNAIDLISLKMPSKRTISLIYKASDTNRKVVSTQSVKALKSGVKSPDDLYPTPERSVSPRIKTDHTYLSLPSVGTTFKVDEIHSKNVCTPESQVAQEEIEEKMAEFSCQESFTSATEPLVDSSKKDLRFTPDLCTFGEVDSGLKEKYSETEDNLEKLSITGAEKINDVDIRLSTSNFASEEEEKSFKLLEGMNSHQRISTEQFRSLNNSLQIKVQEYIELKDRIDRITANINKSL